MMEQYIENEPPPFEFITENVYLDDTGSSRDKKKAKKMVCECQFDPELDDPDTACGEDCLNRLLLIECSSRCPCGEYCTNKRFQRAEYGQVEVFKTDMKGWGLRAVMDLPKDRFVMEYCGEVCSLAEFEERKKVYSMEKRRHYYFMSLKADDIIDATHVGNYSRFINHSCDPNCETQKWTVDGRLRIGFFTVRFIPAGEELTFDYQFQRFGEATAQRCYCGSSNCRGYLGVGKQVNKHQQSPRSNSASPLHRKEKKRKDDIYINLLDPDALFEKQVYDIVGSSWRLVNNAQVLAFSRAMIHAETPVQRNVLLKVLQATSDETCLKKFLSLQGLQLLWSWMVDSYDMTGRQQLEFRINLLSTLKRLPVTTKNQLEDNKIISVIQKWKQEAKQDSTSSNKAATRFTSVNKLDVTVTEADSMEGPLTGTQQEEKEIVKKTTAAEDRKVVPVDKQQTEGKDFKLRSNKDFKQEEEVKEENISEQNKIVESVEVKEDTREREEMDKQTDQEATHEATTAEDTDTTDANPQETVYVIMISPGDITEGDTDLQDEADEATVKDDNDSQEEIDIVTQCNVTVQKETDVLQEPLNNVTHVESSTSLEEHKEECDMKQTADVSPDHNVTSSELTAHEGPLATSQEQDLVLERNITPDLNVPKSEADVPLEEVDETLVVLTDRHKIVQEPDIIQQERRISKEEQPHILLEACDFTHNKRDVDNALHKEHDILQGPDVVPEPDVPQGAKDCTTEEKEESTEGVDNGVIEGEGVLREQQVVPQQQFLPQHCDNILEECRDVYQMPDSDLATGQEHDISLKESNVDANMEHNHALKDSDKVTPQQEQPQEHGDDTPKEQQEEQKAIPTQDEHGVMDQTAHDIVDDVVEHEQHTVRQEIFVKQDGVPNDRVTDQQEADTDEQQHITTQQEHVPIQQMDVAIQQEPVIMKQNVTMHQEQVAMQQEQVSVQQEHVAMQQEQVAIQQEQVAMQREQAAVQQEHVAMQQEQVAMQQEQVAVQQEHIAKQQEQVAMQQEHDMTQQEHDKTLVDHNDTVTEPADTGQHKHNDIAQERDNIIEKDQLQDELVEDKTSITLKTPDVHKGNKSLEEDKIEMTQGLVKVEDLDVAISTHSETVKVENQSGVTSKEPDVQKGPESLKEEDKTEITREGEGLAEDEDMDATTSSQSETTESLGDSLLDDEAMEVSEPQDADWSMTEADKEDNSQSSCESTEGQDDSDTLISSQTTVVEDTETEEQSTTQHLAISSSSSVLAQEQEVALATSTSEKEMVAEYQPDKHGSQTTAVSSEVNIAESCEAEGREMIDSDEELERQQKSSLLKLASDLLEQWSDLKEVYRIPKRSSPPPVSSRTSRKRSHHHRRSRSPSPDSDVELRRRRRQRRREEMGKESWYRHNSYYRSNSNNRRPLRGRRRHHWDSHRSYSNNYNNNVYNDNTAMATSSGASTYSNATGFPTYDQYIQQQTVAAVAAQQYSTSKADGGLVGTATYKLQCYPQQQSVVTTGLVPLKTQEVQQQTQQQQQLQQQQIQQQQIQQQQMQSQQLPHPQQLIPTVSQPAAVAATSLTTAQPLFNSQIVLQPTQVSNPSQQQQPTTPSAVVTSGIFIPPPTNLAPLPPPHITPEIAAAAAAAVAAAATRTIPGTDATAPTPLLQNPLVPLQLQALPVYQPQQAIQQPQATNTMISQQPGGGAVLQQGYVQQNVLPNQLRPLQQQQSAGVLIQQQCYVPVPTTATGATANMQYNVVQQPTLATLPPPPPLSNEEKGLPENWRTARDPAGKIYYYHCITKKTQWERPVAGDVGTLNMEISSNSDPNSTNGSPRLSPVRNVSSASTVSVTTTSIRNPKPIISQVVEPVVQQDVASIPMPSGPVPAKPITAMTIPSLPPLELSTVAAEMKSNASPFAKGSEEGEIIDQFETELNKEDSASGTVTPCDRSSDSKPLSKDAALARDQFKHNISKLVIQCLQYHRKPGCKYGLVTNAEDFKYLARKLTHGLTEKEAFHKKGYENVDFNESVKTKTKEYIRNYMKKFGPIYTRT